MRRTPEPELMNDPVQAKAYAEADFEAPHEHFVALFQEHYSLLSTSESRRPEKNINGQILDLGCGSADVIIRFAKRYPECSVHAVDGADAMLEFARQAVDAAGLNDRISFQKAYFPSGRVKEQDYQAIISNSLLHHLNDAQSLWQVIKAHATSSTFIFVMDLMRPRNEAGAKDLVEEYASAEPEILKHDFYNSLLAAYTVGEVEEQLEKERLLELKVQPVSDRHFVVYGCL
jgi:cyclopropane fatty-acyl-phospholipid synthase-like methyltransferase